MLTCSLIAFLYMSTVLVVMTFMMGDGSLATAVLFFRDHFSSLTHRNVFEDMMFTKPTDMIRQSEPEYNSVLIFFQFIYRSLNSPLFPHTDTFFTRILSFTSITRAIFADLIGTPLHSVQMTYNCEQSARTITL